MRIDELLRSRKPDRQPDLSKLSTPELKTLLDICERAGGELNDNNLHLLDESDRKVLDPILTKAGCNPDFK